MSRPKLPTDAASLHALAKRVFEQIGRENRELEARRRRRLAEIVETCWQRPASGQIESPAFDLATSVLRTT